MRDVGTKAKRVSAMRGPAASVALSLALLCGCATTGADAPEIASEDLGAVKYRGVENPGGPTEGNVARIFLPEACLVSGTGNESLLLATVIPIGIGLGVDLLAGALKSAGSDDAVAVYAARTMERGGNVVAASSGGGSGGGGAGATAPPPPSGAATATGAPGSAPAAASPATAPGAPATATGSSGLTMLSTVSGGTAAAAQESGSGGTHCVQFVYGSFAGSEAEALGSGFFSPAMIAELGLRTNLDERAIFENLARNHVYLKRPPAFFMEAILVDAGNATRLVPTIISYDRTLESGQTGVKRTLLLKYGLNKPGMSMADDSSGKGVLTIGGATAGATYAAFSPNDPRRPQGLWAASALAEKDRYANLEMRLVELRKGAPVLAELGTAIADNKTDLTKAIQQDFFPTAEQRQQALTAEVGALTAYQSQVAAYLSTLDAANAAIKDAQTTFAGDPARVAIERQNQQIVVDIARLGVRKAAEAAGQPMPALPSL